MVPFRCVELSAALAALLLFLTCSLASAATNAPLGLEEARQLAVRQQPQLQAQQAAVRATQQRAISAGQLPDPVLVGGLSDLTLTGPERYTIGKESDTQFSLGLRQSFPGGDKRALRSQRLEREAEQLDAEQADLARVVERETGLAWVAVWQAIQQQALVQAMLDEARHQAEATAIAYRTGRATQAEWLAARVAVEVTQDQLDGLLQSEWHARNQLRRWLPEDAERPLLSTLPPFAVPDLSQLLGGLEQHPHLAVQTRAVAVADVDIDLARAEKLPDWSAQLSYGYRPDYADYASLNVEIGLPLFTHDRQDRDIAAGLAQRDRAQQLRDDWLRQHRAELRLNVDDWQRLQKRMARYDELILPQGQARLDAARASYGAGQGSLMAVLDARRALLDLQMQRLDLQTDTAKHEIALRYFEYSFTPAESLP